MIIRRLATSIREQDWVTVVIETLIVMFGVLLGLQVNNWNSARVERAERVLKYKLNSLPAGEQFLRTGVGEIQQSAPVIIDNGAGETNHRFFWTRRWKFSRFESSRIALVSTPSGSGTGPGRDRPGGWTGEGGSHGLPGSCAPAQLGISSRLRGDADSTGRSFDGGHCGGGASPRVRGFSSQSEQEWREFLPEGSSVLSNDRVLCHHAMRAIG